jgi:putative ATP-binding cassette transporter
LAGPYWNSKNRLIIGTETVLLFVLTVMQIELAVYITQWNAALFDAIEQRSMAGVKNPGSRTNPDLHWRHNGRRCPLIVKRRLLIGWRTWPTEKVISKWIQQGRHYQITLLSQKITTIRTAASHKTFVLGRRRYIAKPFIVLLFTDVGKLRPKLWGISGRVVFEFGSVSIPVMGYVVWISVCHSICASILSWWMGKPMTSATHTRRTREANFRHDLINVQQNLKPSH